MHIYKHCFRNFGNITLSKSQSQSNEIYIKKSLKYTKSVKTEFWKDFTSEISIVFINNKKENPCTVLTHDNIHYVYSLSKRKENPQCLNDNSTITTLRATCIKGDKIHPFIIFRYNLQASKSFD